MIWCEKNHVVQGKAPVADAFAGTAYSDVVNCKNYGHLTFLIVKGVGTTGTSTITVNACDDTTPTTEAAVAFHYRRIQTSDNSPGTLTAATTAGFTTTAGSDEIYVIEVDPAELAKNGYGYCRLVATEVVDAAVLGGIIAILSEPRYGAVAAIA